jgi:hypothetical protein
MELGRQARSANELLAKLTGHLVERRDLRVIRSIEDLSEEELLVLAGAADEDAQRARH